jgi:hypothetical protein
VIVELALDVVLKPRAVIAGHKKPEKDDNPGIIEETRQYIRDFERLAETSTTARELYDKMLELYPDRANPGSLWGSARAVKVGVESHYAIVTTGRRPFFIDDVRHDGSYERDTLLAAIADAVR